MGAVDALVGLRPRQRVFAFAMVLFVVGVAVVVFPARPASATPPTQKLVSLCSVDEWQADLTGCLARLPDVATSRAQCLEAPPPDSPDSGLGGWFASQPEASKHEGQKGPYTNRGYAGYSYTTYDIGCVQTLMHPDYKFENTVANGELMLATGVIGASNALRERAWDPGLMWGWADPLVQKATQSIYRQVFTVFGVVTLAIVGIYLLWRSRQADMSGTMTTAGWALLVMIAVTALAKWPVTSAHLADNTLVSSLSVVHGAVGPPSDAIPPDQCTRADKASCQDIRPPAVRASDTAVETMLYRNWLRGLLGSADSDTAQKYGPALYDARTLTWGEANDARDPTQRAAIINRKSIQWMKISEQIRSEDPDAYQYLQGTKGMERIGAGFIALLSSIMYALFDLTASLLVLLGFLIFRWAVIASPILGTVGLLRPASAGFRRLANAVVASVFNIVIFGSGAAIYLYAVDLIMNTASLPGWLQIVLVWLCGVVGWLLLRPYRRITQLGGKDSTAAIVSAGSWHRRFFRDVADTAPLAVARPGGGSTTALDRPSQRVEVRIDGLGSGDSSPATVEASPTPPRRTSGPTGGGWNEPEYEAQPAYAVYRPRRSATAEDPQDAPALASARAEARQDR